MPELPEVETIRLRLRDGRPAESPRRRGCAREDPPGRRSRTETWAAPPLPGQTITAGRVLWEPTLVTPTARRFRARVRGQRIVEVSRRGKFIVLHLTEDALLFHLRMGGDFQVEPRARPLSPYARLTLDLGARWRLVFCNPRKFGRVWLTDRPEEVLAELGPEPLEPAFTAERFLAMLAKRRGRIKALLLDQTFLAGLGNIYADETLHRAGIHPLARACDLPPDRGRALRRSIRAVLHEAIRHRGTTFDDAYGGGEYFDRLRVYQRTGKPCLRCRTPIARILVAQRGTHFCPICQPRRSRGSA